MNIDSKFIFYISFSDNPEALINAVFLNNGAYFGLRGRQDHVNMTKLFKDNTSKIIYD
jgi:hypothetical protein